MTRIPFRTLGLGMFLAAALAALAIHLGSYDAAAYQRRANHVWALKQLDVGLNQDVLRCRNQLLPHYDTLSQQLEQVRHLEEDLRHGSGSERAHLVAEVEDAFAEKGAAIEQFKARNSIFINSLRFLPAAAHRLRERLVESKAPPSVGVDFQNLEMEVVTFGLVPNPELRVSIQAHLARTASTPNLQPEARGALRLFLEHTQHILEVRPEIDRLIERITRAPGPQRLDALRRFDETESRAESQRSVSYRWALFALGLILFGGAGAAFWNRARTAAFNSKLQREMQTEAEVRRMNAELEERVQARTKQLAIANQELSSSIRELGETQARLAGADRLAAVGQLAAGVAHEINNPLAFILSNLEYAVGELGKQEAVVPEEVVSALKEAVVGGIRVRDIVRGLKVFSRADEESGKVVDLRDILEGTLKMVSNEIRHRARLVTELGEIPRVKCNEGRLGQVFLNLLINAAHATLSGASANEHQVSVITRTSLDGRAVVEIRDTGSGIPEEIRARIFEPFFTTKPVGQGTGLGLSICHGIIANLGGEIEVESEVGRGSTFRVLLPACDEEISDGTSPAAVAQVAPEPRGRILIIDDEPLVGASLRRTLAADHDVLFQQSPAEALKDLRMGHRFDLIICDLMMPEMNGMQFHAEVERLYPERLETLVFLTGGAFTPQARTFIDDPNHVVLEKPIEGPELRAWVRARLGSKSSPSPQPSPAPSELPPPNRERVDARVLGH